MLGKLEKNSPAFPRRGKGPFWMGPHSCEPPRYPKSTAALVQGLNCAQTSQYCACLQNQGLEPGGCAKAFKLLPVSLSFQREEPISQGTGLPHLLTALLDRTPCHGIAVPIPKHQRHRITLSSQQHHQQQSLLTVGRFSFLSFFSFFSFFFFLSFFFFKLPDASSFSRS